MKLHTVILYDRTGSVITEEEVEGTKRAKERANYLLSDGYAVACETTHAALKTMKVAIFAENAHHGPHSVCEWDREHPQHKEYAP